VEQRRKEELQNFADSIQKYKESGDIAGLELVLENFSSAQDYPCADLDELIQQGSEVLKQMKVGRQAQEETAAEQRLEDAMQHMAHLNKQISDAIQLVTNLDKMNLGRQSAESEQRYKKRCRISLKHFHPDKAINLSAQCNVHLRDIAIPGAEGIHEHGEMVAKIKQQIRMLEKDRVLDLSYKDFFSKTHAGTVDPITSQEEILKYMKEVASTHNTADLSLSNRAMCEQLKRMFLDGTVRRLHADLTYCYSRLSQCMPPRPEDLQLGPEDLQLLIPM